VRSWKKQIPVFAEAGYRAIAYDRWGHGKSAARGRYGMPDFQPDRQDLEALLEALGVERAALIGHSDGGTLGLYFAAAHPERVTALVAVSAHIYLEARMGAGIQGVLQTFEQDLELRSKFYRVHGENAAALFNGWYSGWTDPEHRGWDLRATLARILCPALVVQGLEDEHATPQHARDLAAGMPHAELWLLPGAGHMLPQDLPETFNDRVLEFLRRWTMDDRLSSMVHGPLSQERRGDVQ
jgi:pimeloyl-ACP methyl ester carboxylesterase